MTGARSATRKPRALVTGGAGFIGSHLCERLLSEGCRVVCIDNLSTGVLQNVAPFLASEADFCYVDHDVSLHIDFPGELDEVYHFASHMEKQGSWPSSAATWPVARPQR